MASSRNLVSTIGAQVSPKREMESGVLKGKRSLLTCHTRVTNDPWKPVVIRLHKNGVNND